MIIENKKWKCEVCGEIFDSNQKWTAHIHKKHNMTSKDYYDKYLKKCGEGICLNCGKPTRLWNCTLGYFKFCCTDCQYEYAKKKPRTGNRHLKMEYVKKHGKYKCEICGNQTNGLGSHIIQVHHITCKEYYDTYIRKPGEGICPTCGKETKFLGIRKGGYMTHCNGTCAQRDANVTKKKKESSKRIHGVENYRNGKQARKTFNENHTIEEQEVYYKKIIEKRDSVDEETKEKRKKQAKTTRYEKNGEGKWVSDETIKQTKETKKIRHGDENWNNREKFKETCLNKWGQTYPHYWNYTYKGIHFDSSWEIIYYIWLTDNNIDFEYHPSIKKTKLFYYWKDKKYYYYVDFIVNGEYVELKNEFLYSKLLIENTKENEKYKLMVKNNVKIIRNEDMIPYFNYIAEKYGNDYIQQFKKSKKL